MKYGCENAVVIDKNKASESPTFCLLPWTHVMSGIGGYYKPCCNTVTGFTDLRVENLSLSEAFQSDSMNKLRAQLSNGEKPSICDVCWIREEKGHRSYRINYLKKFEALLEQDLSPKLRYLDLRIDNSCNLQCRMCDPISSDQIWKTINYFKKKDMKIPSHYTQKLKGAEKNYFQEKKLAHVLEVLEDVRVIKVTGGEPFKSKEFLQIMDAAISRNLAKNIDIIFTTNGTKFFRPVLERMQEFKTTELNISIDGVGAVYDYIRYPFKFSQWCERMEELFLHMERNDLWVNDKFLLRTSCIVSAYNWLNIAEIHNHLKSYDERF